MQEAAQKPPVQSASLVAQRQELDTDAAPVAQLADARQGRLAGIAAQLNGAPRVQAIAQAKASVAPRAEALAAKGAAPVQRAANRTGLPDALKSGVEALSGVSMDNVSVHYNSSKPAQLNAHAYAQGTDIHVGPGQEHHLPHEAWHVVQQAQGRVRPTRQLKAGVPINDEAGLEREADVMGQKAAAMGGDASAGAAAAPAQAKPLYGMPPVQRRMGLELEFPIPVDNLGVLTNEQDAMLKRALPDEPRKQLQVGASLDKSTTIITGEGYVVRPDHNAKAGSLAQQTPAQSTSNNIMEFIFQPPVEALYEVEEVLDNIFDKVAAIGASTNGLTTRAQLTGNYYVGPINTGGAKPAGLGLEAYSMQINFGIETQKIPDLFMAYAHSTDLADDTLRAAAGPEHGDEAARIAKIYRDTIVEAALLSARVEEDFRKHVVEVTPLLGIRGLLAVEALYLLMGALPEKDRFPGTVKNFTPLLMKSSLSWIADYSLTPTEKELWAKYKVPLLTELMKASGKHGGVGLGDMLVSGDKGAKTGIKIQDMLTDKLDGPMIVPGAGIMPDSVGNTRSKSDPSVRKQDKIAYPEYLTAPPRAPTKEEIAKYGPELAKLLAPSSVEPSEQDLRKEEENARKRNRRRGGVFETRVADGNFTRGSAKARAKEMFMRVGILHGLTDKDMMTSARQTDTAKRELGLED